MSAKRFFLTGSLTSLVLAFLFVVGQSIQATPLDARGLTPFASFKFPTFTATRTAVSPPTAVPFPTRPPVPTSTSDPNAPHIAWAPNPMNIPIPPGARWTTSVTFKSTRNLTNVNFLLTLPVGSAIELAPTRFDAVTAGTVNTITLTMSIPMQPMLKVYSVSMNAYPGNNPYPLLDTLRLNYLVDFPTPTPSATRNPNDPYITWSPRGIKTFIMPEQTINHAVSFVSNKDLGETSLVWSGDIPSGISYEVVPNRISQIVAGVSYSVTLKITSHSNLYFSFTQLLNAQGNNTTIPDPLYVSVVNSAPPTPIPPTPAPTTTPVVFIITQTVIIMGTPVQIPTTTPAWFPPPTNAPTSTPSLTPTWFPSSTPTIAPTTDPYATATDTPPPTPTEQPYP